jgi:hypothetical protein
VQPIGKAFAVTSQWVYLPWNMENPEGDPAWPVAMAAQAAQQ